MAATLYGTHCVLQKDVGQVMCIYIASLDTVGKIALTHRHNECVYSVKIIYMYLKKKQLSLT